MPQDPQRFRLSRQGLMFAMVSAAFAGNAWSETAAQVDFAVGSVTATGQDGRVRALPKGAEVLIGDRVETTAGRAQLRFTDGAYVSLQPNTTFEVRQYRFTGKTDGTERGVFGLLRGAFRTVTGLIGRVNRGAYEIQTPTATVGIRGTGGVIQMLADGTLRVTGTSGTWFINKPDRKQLDVPAGTVGEASPNPDEDPQETTEEVILVPPQPEEQQIAGLSKFPLPSGRTEFLAGEQVNQFGEYTAIVGTTAGASPTTPPLSLDGFFDAAGYVTHDPVPPNVIIGPQLYGADGTFDPVVGTTPSQGKLQDFANPSLASPAERWTLNGGTHAEHGVVFVPSTSDQLILAWGRWIGQVDKNGLPYANFGPSQGLHYIVGLPTLPTQVPTAGQFTYNMIGATAPTDGASSPGTFSGTLVGDFVNATVGLQGTATVGGQGYSFQTAGFTTTGPNPNGIPLNVTATSNSFVASGIGPISATGGCASGCATDVKGAFYGNGASHAGIVYRINSFGIEEIAGAAAFAK